MGAGLSEGQRRLAAIMFTDMVGYTALTQSNESQAMGVLERHNRLLRPFFPRFHGREVKTIGDSFLVEFESALDATRCAVDIQTYLHDYNSSSKDEWKVKLRIGIHLGDVIHQRNDVFGDAVNIASRIQPLAQPEGVCVSQQVYDQVRNKLERSLIPLGPVQLKNVEGSVDVYRVEMPWEEERGHDMLTGRRVAVLPLANMSPDPNDEYFSDGLTEELISTLSKIGELRVISRTSVMQYKDKSKSIRDIGRELGAGTILEGSVRKAGDKVRVTIQMIEGASDLHLWSESYDRELKDIFAIQSDIAQQVASALRVRLLSNEKKDIERKPTENMQAYQLYLQGIYHLNRETREDAAKALGYLQKATGLDPNFALAYASISDYYHTASHYNWLSPEDAFPKMKEFATRALELDSRLAEGHASLGAVYFHYDWNWREAEKEFARAIELKPSYDGAYSMYYYLLAVMGRYPESYEIAKRGAEASPQFGVRGWGSALAGALLRMGRASEAVTRVEELVAQDPDYAGLHSFLGIVYFEAGRTGDAISELRKAVDLSKGEQNFKAGLASVLAIDGQKEEATSILRNLEEASKKTYVSDVSLACILHCLGRKDEAFDHIEKAFARKAIDLPDVRTDPVFSRLRSDPRWESVEARMGLRA